MKPEQVMVANLAAALLLATLMGLAARGRVRLCRAFAVYLALALTTNRLVTWWPERFYTRDFWTFNETLQAILIPLVALELMVVATRGLPEAFPRARRAGVVALTLIAAATVLAMAATPARDYAARMGVLAWAQAGAAWSFVAFLAIACWYRLPLHPMHRSITLGFALHLGIYGALLGALGHFGESAYRYVAALDPAAYTATVGVWMLAAWRPEPGSAPGHQAPRSLYPWLNP